MVGISQQELARRIGMAPVVLGRVELGTRPARATELHAIASALGVSAADLLRVLTPVDPSWVVGRADSLRDMCQSHLHQYIQAFVDSVAAVRKSELGVPMDGDVFLDDADDVRDYLMREPRGRGEKLDEDLVPLVRELLLDLVYRKVPPGEGERG